jgi:hypothetical protein
VWVTKGKRPPERAIPDAISIFCNQFQLGSESTAMLAHLLYAMAKDQVDAWSAVIIGVL